ncbi:MAG: hypothetical protein WD638_04230, partial [Nitriliruptoraceae bacterium]
MNITRNRAWRPLAAATALALVAVACGGDGGNGEAETADSGEVTILHAFTGDEDTEGLNAILDSFMEEYPDIEVLQEGSNDFE